MAANNNPIFSKSGAIQWAAAALAAANTAKDGTGTVTTVFTAGVEGNFLHKLIARPRGTNVATVLRVFVNNGLTNATAANNTLISELTLPATTLSEVAAQPAFELPINFILPTGHVVFCTLGTAVAAGFSITMIAGEY